MRTALQVTRPALEFIAPYQTVCNYPVYFFHALGEDQSPVQNGVTGGGTVLNQNVKMLNNDQENSQGSSESSRAWGVPPNVDPIGAKDASGQPLGRLYSPPYKPAIDAQGNADCQNGQLGWMKGPLATGARYGRAIVPGSVDPQHPDGVDSAAAAGP